MVRQDWYYLQISKEQAKFFDDIVEKEGRKYGIKDKAELVRSILSKFQESYELEKLLVCAKHHIRYKSILL